ncbi:spore germination protein GerPE [Bacillus infantis]|jgi:spore germination protein PE|uniref:spore germination protein GerPE n=1 Tax=Bacillus infantis TaxID=324767 RepID=UPI001CD3D997|nr:spore germination protein GerPE [Bacillus infantis]MCA1039455.1 spore germination protein GerPE [Bacillus infantis]MCR6610000.1 spore germination protein GerPE [Bacillus infantis]
MLQRTAIVNKLNVDTVSFSSIIQVGDSEYIQGFSRALAVQREAEIFFGNEGRYSDYPIFTEPLPLPALEDALQMYVHQSKPAIKVDSIDIIGISASSMLHIGNSGQVSMESRVKHIRQLLPLQET